MQVITATSLVLAAALAVPGAAGAATIDVVLSGGVIMAGVNATAAETDAFFFNPGPVDALSAARTEVAQAGGPFGSGSVRAEHSVDATTGQLRFGLDAQVSAVPDGRGSVDTFATLALRETYFLSGIGRVTVGMELSANWNAQFYNVQGFALYDEAARPDTIPRALVTPVGPIGRGYFDQFTDGPGAGSVSGLILESTFDLFAPDGGFMDFFWFLQGGVAIPGGILPSETAFLDAMNTANIFVRVEGDVTAAAQTAGFLSNPAFGGGAGGGGTGGDPDVSVVPLPASAVLLMAGLAGLGLVRRRRTG